MLSLKGLAKAGAVAALTALLGAAEAPTLPAPVSRIVLPGAIVATPGAPVALTDCRSAIVRRALVGRFAATVEPFAAYRNVSGKPVDAVAISITDLDARGADIEEHIHSDSPNFPPGGSFTSTWLRMEFPADVAAVRCVVRAVTYTDGTEWGTWPTTAVERNRAFRPVDCGAPLNQPQPADALREPRPGARDVDPKRVRIVLRSDAPAIGLVRALHLVPDAGRVIRLASYDELKPLFDSTTTDAAPFDGSITVEGLRARTNYRVVLDVMDFQRSRTNCPVMLEESLGDFTTGG